jgi:hypothetical protein
VTKLWRVTSGQFCGAFVVDADLDRVILAAPFLARRVMGRTETQALNIVMKYPGTKVEQVK